MVFTENDLQEKLAELRGQFKKSVSNIENEFEDHFNWIQSVCEGVKNGSISMQSVLVPKTPGKGRARAPLHAIRESLESTIDIDEDRKPKPKATKNKRVSKKTKTVAAQKRSSACTVVKEEQLEESASKRLCQSRPSETVSRDSGLSSVGSRNTQGSNLGGIMVKQELVSPINRSMESTFSESKIEDTSAKSADKTKTTAPTRKRTQSAGRGTFVVDVNPKRVSRSSSDSRKSEANDQTFIMTKSPSRPLDANQERTLRSPMIVKAPPVHLLMGESVKKAVKAFEALNEHEDLDSPQAKSCSKMPPPAITIPPPSQPSVASLDDAVNAPTRVTRTKTRAMAKAAAAEEALVSNPTHVQTQTVSQTQNTTLSSSRFLMKPLGSCSKTNNSLFLKPSTPLNRINTMTPSTSFAGPRNIVTSVESFITKPVVIQEVQASREEKFQKLVAKAESASKKKEEIMKAQMEEKMKKRQEKRLKVCAAREAMEKEKQEMQSKLEREREERHRLLQAEREEKLRQEYIKKKRLAQLKAAETEERRRQEEAARLAKLKQQEEEQRRIAAQRQKEHEEAEKKQQERLRQEREAAALRLKEAERLAKEVKRPPGPQSYGLTPAPEDRHPEPSSNPDNYGIDDVGTDDSSEDESKPKKVVPFWAQSKQRVPKLLDDYEVTLQQMFVFFGSKKSTPDLSKIFTSIDRRQLLRKSSAVWRTPPNKLQQY